MKIRLPIVLLPALLLGALTIGCGGDEGTTPQCGPNGEGCFTQPDGGAKAPPSKSDAGADTAK